MPRRFGSALATFNRLVPKDRGGRLLAGGLAYGEHERQRLDLYAPSDHAGSARLPVVMFFYGGSWRSGFREGYQWLGRALAAHGFLAAVVDYRLVPEGRFPAFLEDCALAVRWLRRRAHDHGGDGERQVLTGQSAGAYIAAMLALDRQWLGEAHSALRGWIGIAGPYVFGAANAVTAAAFGPTGPAAASQPVNLANPASPPALLLHGSDDHIVRPASSEEMARRLRAAGVRAQVKIYPGVDHVTSVTSLALPFRRKAPLLHDALAFAREVTCP